MNASTATLPLEHRRAYVRRVRVAIERIARRGHCSFAQASRRLQERSGLSLRSYHDLQAGRLHRVPRVAVERVEAVMRKVEARA